MAFMSAQHTPGPWRVFTTLSGGQIIGIGELTGDGVADCGFGVWRGGSEEALANARLIAAAPDLLHWLTVLVETYGGPDPRRDAPNLKSARAAIAKATGESS